MALATVTDSTPTRKSSKAFFATFHGLSGALVKPADHVLFLDAESGAAVRLTEADYPNLIVLGQVGESTVQHLEDRLRGGYAAIACARNQGRR
jgi:dihydrodipicolinate synthase/N-acetylneuraminate lyase